MPEARTRMEAVRSPVIHVIVFYGKSGLVDISPQDNFSMYSYVHIILTVLSSDRIGHIISFCHFISFKKKDMKNPD